MPLRQASGGPILLGWGGEAALSGGGRSLVKYIYNGVHDIDGRIWGVRLGISWIVCGLSASFFAFL